MASVRSCKTEGCPYPAASRRQLCGYHWLAKQPAAVQTAAARDRFLAAPPSMRVARVPSAQWPEGTRFCSGCCSFVPLFYCSGSRCKACSSAANHHGHIQKTYGIGTRDYNAIWEAQGRRCPICGGRPRKKRFPVDHDHQLTGREAVRGILCKRCNHELLGPAHDDVELLRRAIKYLENPPARRVLDSGGTVIP